MNKKDETYNGWVNYETWHVNLLMENDYVIYRTVQDKMVDFVLDQLSDLSEPYTDVDLAKACEQAKPAFSKYYKGKVQQLLNTDFLSGIEYKDLKKIDWAYIADHEFAEWIHYPEYLRDAIENERPSNLTLRMAMGWVHKWGNYKRVNHILQWEGHEKAKEKLIEIRGRNTDTNYYELAARVWQTLADDPVGKHFELPDQRKIQSYIKHHVEWNKPWMVKALTLHVRPTAESRSSYTLLHISFGIVKDEVDDSEDE